MDPAEKVIAASARLFAAVQVSDAVRENLSRWIERMKQRPEIPPNTKWVEEDNIHLTLKFFGEVKEQDLDKLRKCLGEAVKNTQGFNMEVRGIGAFPNFQHPIVIWAGAHDSSEITRLALVIERMATEQGFQANGKPFSPHLTLARLNRPARHGLANVLEKSAQSFFGAAPVDALYLIQSILTLEGPRYKEVERWPFKLDDSSVVNRLM